MSNTSSSHRLPLILAITLHILLFAFLFIHLATPDARNLQLQPDVNIIKAVAVNPAETVAQTTQIKAEAEQKQHEIEQAAQKLQQEQAAAKAAQQQKEAETAAQKQAEAAALVEQQKAEQKALEQKQIQEVAAQKKAEKLVEAKKAAEAKKAVEAKELAEEKAKQAELKKQQQAKKDADKKKQQKAAQDLKLAQQKELESQMAAEQKQLEAARTNENQSEIEKYTALILHTMRQNWIMPDGINPEISCQLAIRLKSDGTVLSVTVIRSSGNAALDNSARAAVFKSSPLPVPADKDLFDSTFREFNLTVSKKD